MQKNALFMPKIASRITLRVKSVRIERLNEISEKDAISEGIAQELPFNDRDSIYRNYLKDNDYVNAIDSYKSLWEKINGNGSWSLNPLVWVIDFEPSFS